MKMIPGKMIFFFLVAFWKMLQKIVYSVVQMIEQKGRGEASVFWKMVYEKIGCKLFSKF